MKLAALLLALLCCQSSFAWDSPRQAVDEFLKFELSGGRGRTWAFEKYIVADPDYNEPGWDMFHIVKDAKVLSMVCAQQSCVAEVKFSFVPTRRLRLYQIFSHPNGGSQVAKFVAIRHNGEWLLDSSGPGAPMVTYAAYKQLYPNER